MESIVLVLLDVLAQLCCIFWKKKKLQGLDLGKFLEKRRWLRSQKRVLDRMITEVEQKASEEGDEEQVMEKLNELVKGRESIKRKLSTTYSLGRDGERSRAKSLLPLHDGKSRSYSFHTLSSDEEDDESSSSDSGELSSLMEEADDDLSQDEVGGGANEEEISCSDEDGRVCMKPMDADSGSEHGSENDGARESGSEAINSESLPLNSEVIDQIHEPYLMEDG